VSLRGVLLGRGEYIWTAGGRKFWPLDPRIEDVFIEDMRERGIEVMRSSPFLRYSTEGGADAPIEVVCENKKTGSTRTFKTRYLVGCDGAHSNVRKSIPGAQMVGESSNSKWGVLDGKTPGPTSI